MKVKIQPDNYSCGIYSVINALLVYGENLSREEIKPLTGTTSREGTDEKGIQKALTELGYRYKVYTTKKSDNAWRWILNNSKNRPLILYLDKNHWLVVAGRVKNKVILIDSCSSAEIIGKKELLLRWKPYWGMSIY